MEEFSTALEEGDEGTVLRLLDADPTLLERMVDMWNRPLALAADHGHVRLTRLLIERGANVNATGRYGNTALHCAAQDGQAEVVALLLRGGAHATSRNDDDKTPLMCACDEGHLGVVKMLVQHMGGQGLDDGDEDGWTALHGAADEGHEEVVRFLLLAGADPTIMNIWGRTSSALVEEAITYSEILREGRARCVAVFQVRPLIMCKPA
jgi:ankyrin repeat protein